MLLQSLAHWLKKLRLIVQTMSQYEGGSDNKEFDDLVTTAELFDLTLHQNRNAYPGVKMQQNRHQKPMPTKSEQTFFPRFFDYIYNIVKCRLLFSLALVV